MSRLLGSVAPTVTTVAAAPATASRFGLIGIVANRSNGGVAVISVDGKPAKPFQVGSKIDDNLILQAVAARRADIGVDAKGPPVFTLELAPLKK